ncbi:MAG TPA: tripartite tricarboxylate transporter substrate binding protein [Xanthobacteraceae bacterium]|nr:tripartite tricarboxylate transporter substrate binding protein [Xanthobacteraceae bacterium]
MRLLWRGIALAWLAFTTPAMAETYPDHPIKLIVPISVGSITDVAARLAAQDLQERLGQPVVVVNRPGAAMVLGGTDCAKSPPDGYTLCLVSPDTMSFNPLTVPNLPYDPDKDFTPVIDMYNVIEGLIVPAATGVSSIEQLRAKAAAEPGKLNYGTLGERTTTDAFRQWLGEHWNTKFVAIPYKGGSEITSALLGDTIDVTKIGIGNMVSQLKDGKIKILALTASHRWPQLSNIPTFAEAGFGAYPGGPIYWGVVVPTGTPAPIVARLHDALLAIFQSEKFKDFANQNFLEPAAGSTGDFAAFLKKDRQSAEVLVNKYMK